MISTKPKKSSIKFSEEVLKGESRLGIYTSYSEGARNKGYSGTKQGKSDQFKTKIDKGIGSDYCSNTAIIERFALKSAASEILITKKRNGNIDRTWHCLRTPLPNVDEIPLKQSKAHGKCHFKNLMTCGSVWKCPICNAKISENRAKEIRTVIDSHIKAGGKVALLTFTIPHERQDNLKFMLKASQTAFDRTWKANPIKKLKVIIGMVGYVKSREVTYGHANGWHPHFHQLVLYFSDDHETNILELMKEEIYPVWANRCEKLGLGIPSYERGLDVRGGMDAADYIAKFEKKQEWGLDKELTKGHVKKSKIKDRFSPFDLLRDYIVTNSKNMARLYLEYADAFHGKRFVVWSQGLKDKYGVNDTVEADKKIAESTDDLASLVGLIDLKDWRKIIFHKQVATIKILGEQGWLVVSDFIDSLPRPYKTKYVKKPFRERYSNY